MAMDDLVNPSTNLMVTYLPPAMCEDELYSIFVSCGPLKSVKIVRNRVTQYSQGYGFVVFQDKDDAANAIKTFDGFHLQNKRLHVFYAENKKHEKNSKLYVSYLGENIEKSDVEELFSPFGRVLSVSLLLDKDTNCPKGVAFVQFSTQSEAESAIMALNGSKYDKSGLNIIVKLAEDPRKKDAFVAQYMSQQLYNKY